MSNTTSPVIRNKKAGYEYDVLEKYTAGIVLTGSEIKSVRAGKVNLSDGFCYFKKDELYVRNIHIAEYKHGGYANHEPLRQRKLLLTKKELHRLQSKAKERGLTIVPLSMFINSRGYAKLDIALVRGKKKYDKRESIKEREAQKQLNRIWKQKR